MTTLRDLWRAWQHKRAQKIRRELKRAALLEDAYKFYDGEKTAAESRQFREALAAKIDSMSDEEILRQRHKIR
jgi:hypothetical protein